MISSTIFVCSFLLGAAFAGPQGHSVSKEKLKEAALMIVNDCKEQTGATDEDMVSLKEHKMPKSQSGLCLIECLFNTAKVMKDGKFNKAGAIEFATPAMKGDATKMQKMNDMMTLCEKEISAGTETDGCKVAKKVAECTAIHGKEFGFEFPNHLKE